MEAGEKLLLRVVTYCRTRVYRAGNKSLVLPLCSCCGVLMMGGELHVYTDGTSTGTGVFWDTQAESTSTSAAGTAYPPVTVLLNCVQQAADAMMCARSDERRLPRVATQQRSRALLRRAMRRSRKAAARLLCTCAVGVCAGVGALGSPTAHTGVDCTHTHTDILESGMLLWYEHARSHPQLRLPADLNAIIKRLEPAQEVHIITSQPQLVAPLLTHTTIANTHTTTGLSVCACHSTSAEAHE